MSSHPARRAAAVLAALSALILLPPALHGQEVDERLEATRERLDEAREEGLPYLTPDAYRAAEEALGRAGRLRARDAGADAVLEALGRAQSALARADSTAPRSRRLLGPGRATRAVAREAGAEELAPEAWSRAEEALRSAGRAAVREEARRARERTSGAVELYRRAALEALEETLLADAQAARDTAHRRDALERAPRSWRRADSLLARAERAVVRSVAEAASGEEAGAVEPGARAAARATADSARALFRRAARLSALADSVRQREGAFEEAALAYEGAVSRIADSLGAELGPGPGVEAAVETVLEAAARRADTLRRLRSRLDSVRAAARRADERADSLAGRLAELGGRLDSVEARLRPRLARERRLREVRAVFADEDARVRVADDSVVLELFGLAFEPGEAELARGDNPLLARARSAIRSFPDAEVVVHGHTDARGDEARNRRLSRERAVAVRDRLLLHLPISADRVSAVGFGETRPVATNDTEAGRARNRRIDIVLVLPPARGAAGEAAARDSAAADTTPGPAAPPR